MDNPQNSIVNSFSPRSIAKVLAVTAIYYAAGKFGLALASIHPSSSAVWPASGIALTVILLFGKQLWPGIFLGAFLVNVTTAGNTATSFGIATGNTLEALTGAFLMQHFAGGRNAFDHPMMVLRYVILVAGLSTMISATVGVVSLILGGYAVWATFGSIWTTWWLGDLVGDLIVAPFLLLWFLPPRLRLDGPQAIEAVVIALLVFIITQIQFNVWFPEADYSLIFVGWPLLLWAIFRYEQRGTMTIVLLMSILAIWWTTQGYGTFASEGPQTGLLLLQGYLGTVSAVTLGVSALLAERRRVQEKYTTLLDRFREQAQTLQAILTTSVDNIYVINREGRYLYVSDSGAAILGHHREDIVGKHWSELDIPEDVKTRFEIQHRTVLSTGQPQVIEASFQHGGSIRHYEYVITPLPTDLNGEIPAVAIISRDITERKNSEIDVRQMNQKLEERVRMRTAELEKQRRELQVFIDSMSTLTAKVASNGKLLAVNRIAEQASGLTREKLLQTNFLEGQWWSFDPEVQQRVREAFQRACNGQSINYDEKIFAFGKIMTISFSLVPVFDDTGKHVEYIVAEGRDITQLKETEEALRRQAAELQAAMRELEAFSYSVSHDLRAPLRAISGYAGLLGSESLEKFSPEERSWLRNISDNASNLGKLVDELLKFSRLGRQELQMTLIDMKKLVDTIAVECADERSAGQKPEIIIHPLPNALGDPVLVRQVFWNLLSNAFKFTRKVSSPRVEIGSSNHSVDGMNTYFVRDNGVGFETKYQDKLFGVFQRLHRADEYEGTGIGLAFSKRIIERHGGSIWGESEIGKGATFYFRLPDRSHS